MENLFGTDGIRGEVGRYPLTQEAVFKIGRTLGIWLKEQYPQQRGSLKVLLGKDTRESGNELELALLKGANLEGLQVVRLGTSPTPTVAYLATALGAHLGVAISASHNPCTDNGIKFFDSGGYKLLPPAERRIEEIFSSLSSESLDFYLKLEDFKEESEYLSLYMDFAKDSLEKADLSGYKVVIDCAFGAFSHIAPEVFRKLGADTLVINNQPDGKNINVNCGTLYPQVMAKEILRYRADLGIAFDGDGDRVIVADEKGNILDGDYILAILAKHYQQQNQLSSNLLICTQMSNIGLELYLQRQGIQTIRTDVGDKYVLDEMRKQKASLGGEQSGHIIILGRTTTGDGLIVALELIKVMLKHKMRMSELSGDFQKFPQVLENVRVIEKRPFEQIPRLSEEIIRCQSELGKEGRILIRYSGTENLARIMVEGKDHSLVKRYSNSLAGIIKDAVGES